MRSKPASRQDDDQDDHSVQRVIRAAGAKPPATSAPNSVFDIARKAQAENTVPPLMPHQIVIRKGVAKPSVRSGLGLGYVEVIQRMQPTDSVELPLKQAMSFYARANEFGKNAAPPPAVQHAQAQRHSGRHLA